MDIKVTVTLDQSTLDALSQFAGMLAGAVEKSKPAVEARKPYHTTDGEPIEKPKPTKKTEPVPDEAIETAKQEAPAAKAVAEVEDDNKPIEVTHEAAGRLCKEVASLGGDRAKIKEMVHKAAGAPEGKKVLVADLTHEQLAKLNMDLGIYKTRLTNA